MEYVHQLVSALSEKYGEGKSFYSVKTEQISVHIASTIKFPLTLVSWEKDTGDFWLSCVLPE